MNTSMETRRLRGLDRAVSALGAGCWTIGGPSTNHGKPVGWDHANRDRALAGLWRAYELGVRLFDTADAYGFGRSERLLGRLLAAVPRDEVVVSSKVGYIPGPGTHPYEPQQMRHRLERTLTNLGTDHLDLYFFHSSDFGPAGEHLPAAIDQMRAFVASGLVHAIGMRAPHAFAVEWATGPAQDARPTEAARFLHHFHKIQPDVVTARYNLLSPLYAAQETDLFTLARTHGVGIIIKQALGQGVLLGTHPPNAPRTFGPGDHRRTDPMFSPETLRRIHDGLAPIKERFGATVRDLARVALRYALAHDPHVPVLVGFRDAEQITATITSLGPPLTGDEIAWLHDSLQDLRKALAVLAAKRAARDGQSP